MKFFLEAIVVVCRAKFLRVQFEPLNLAINLIIFTTFNQQKYSTMNQSQDVSKTVKTSKIDGTIHQKHSQQILGESGQQQKMVNKSNSADRGKVLTSESVVIISKSQEKEQQKSLQKSKSMQKQIEKLKQRDQSKMEFISENKQLQIENENLEGFNEFAGAWKFEIDISVILMQKISLIVHDYYKIVPQLERTMQQMDLLIVYNKSLLQILNKFEDQERKIINKLKSMQELNLKIMKQLCHVKNKPFRLPEIKFQQSIFAKFNLYELTFEPRQRKKVMINQSYENQLQTLFQTHLLHPFSTQLETLDKKLAEVKGKQQKEEQIQLATIIEDLKSKVIKYNQDIKTASKDNMFHLFNVKMALQNQISSLQLNNVSPPNVGEGEKSFVNEVYKIHAGISNLEEDQIQKFLKMEKQIRRKLKKQRIKEQQKFIRNYESIKSENIELSKDVKKYKQRSVSLQNDLTHIKLQKDYKKMKKNSPSTNLMNKSAIEQSELNMTEEKTHKNMLIDSNKTLVAELNKLKIENQKCLQSISVFKKREVNRSFLLPRIREKAKRMQIILDPKWEEIKIIQYLLARINASGLTGKDLENKIAQVTDIATDGKLKVPQHAGEDGLVSPVMDDRSFYGFQAASHAPYLCPIPQNSQTDDLEAKNRQLEKEIQVLKKKNEQNRTLIATKNQDFRRMLQDHENTLKQKNSKINQLVKEYERFQNQIKQLKLTNQLLRVKNQCAEKLSERIIKTVQETSVTDFVPKHLPVINQMFSRFKLFINDYFAQTKKEEEAHEERIQISILRQGERDELSSRHGNPNDQSEASLKSQWAKNRSKKQSDVFSNKSKEDEPKPKTKLKNFKSLNNDLHLEQELERQLNLKKTPSKKLGPLSPQKSPDRSISKQRQKLSQNINQDSQQKLQVTVDLIDMSKEKQKKKMQQEKKNIEFSFQSEAEPFHKNFQLAKMSSTDLGLLKVAQKNKTNEKVLTDQNQFVNISKYKNESISYDKIQKSETSKNKNSSNKMEEEHKEFPTLFSLFDNNHHDNIDCVSENVKQVCNNEFKEEEKKGSRKQEKKNKVEMNDNMKGSLKIQMVSSHRYRNNQKNDSKKLIQDELPSIEKKTSKKSLRESNEKTQENKKVKSTLAQNSGDTGKKQIQKSMQEGSKEYKGKDEKNEKQKEQQILDMSQQSQKSKGELSSPTYKVNIISAPQIKKAVVNEPQRKGASEKDIKGTNELGKDTQNIGDPVNLNSIDKTKSSQVPNQIKHPVLMKQSLSSTKNQNSQNLQNETKKVTFEPAKMVSNKVPQMEKPKNNEIPVAKPAKNVVESSQARQQGSQSGQNSKYNRQSQLYRESTQHARQRNLHHHADIQNERIMERIRKLGDIDDALDFIELYNRYKQAITCLQASQSLNRANEIKYEKFRSEIRTKKRGTGLSMQQQLYYLRKVVKQQQQKIEQFDKRYNEEMLKTIKMSEDYIKQHLNMLREQNRLQQQEEELKKKLFI